MHHVNVVDVDDVDYDDSDWYAQRLLMCRRICGIQKKKILINSRVDDFSHFILLLTSTVSAHVKIGQEAQFILQPGYLMRWQIVWSVYQ